MSEGGRTSAVLAGRYQIEAEIGRLAASRVTPSEPANALLQQRGTDALTQPALASELL